jgi:Tol biopolymer transport system component
LGLPFRIAIPLNMVEMPLGETRVSVNAVEASFDWQAQPGVMASPETGGAAPTPGRIAYISNDGNLWVLDQAGSQPRQITTDGDPAMLTEAQPDQIVSYYFPRLSSDGALLAYRRDEGIAIESGYQTTFGLWVADLNTGEIRQVIDQTPAGFAWKPGTHVLTYGLGTPTEYFMPRGQPNAELATGIWTVDLAGGEPVELVRPERGLSLARPIWAPDSSYLSFEEVYNMEGSGLFVTYDLGAQKYIPWEKALGHVDWSPDGAQIAYDFMVYTATGTERIYLNSSAGGAEQQFSPDLPQGFAWHPAFSPQGDRLAYIQNEGGVDDFLRSLVVKNLSGGEPQVLGVFENILDLEWTPDGGSLIFSAGPFEARQVMQVNVSDGSSTVLAEGGNPAMTTP